jgi:acyl dehydratase
VQQIRFDDIPALRALISDEFGPWGPAMAFSQQTIDDFARLTGDNQWIHVDVERSRTGPFGATIAHGFLTLAMLPALRPPSTFEIVGAGSLINYGGEKLRFLAPVRADVPVRSRLRVLDVREHKRGTLVIQEMQVCLAATDLPAMSYQGMLLYTP